jgi:hypothetical protein
MFPFPVKMALVSNESPHDHRKCFIAGCSQRPTLGLMTMPNRKTRAFTMSCALEISSLHKSTLFSSLPILSLSSLVAAIDAAVSSLVDAIVAAVSSLVAAMAASLDSLLAAITFRYAVSLAAIRFFGCCDGCVT